MSSKSIRIILSYTVSKLMHFLRQCTVISCWALQWMQPSLADKCFLQQKNDYVASISQACWTMKAEISTQKPRLIFTLQYRHLGLQTRPDVSSTASLGTATVIPLWHFLYNLAFFSLGQLKKWKQDRPSKMKIQSEKNNLYFMLIVFLIEFSFC